MDAYLCVWLCAIFCEIRKELKYIYAFLKSQIRDLTKKTVIAYREIICSVFDRICLGNRVRESLSHGPPPPKYNTDDDAATIRQHHNAQIQNAHTQHCRVTWTNLTTQLCGVLLTVSLALSSTFRLSSTTANSPCACLALSSPRPFVLRGGLVVHSAPLCLAPRFEPQVFLYMNTIADAFNLPWWISQTTFNLKQLKQNVLIA